MLLIISLAWQARAQLAQYEGFRKSSEESLDPSKDDTDEPTIQQQLQAAAVQDLTCKSVALSDHEYIERLAQQGNAEAQYLTGAYYDLPRGSDNRTFSDEAADWFKKSAAQGNIKANGWLCDRYIQSRTKEKLPEDLKACYIAADHAHIGSLGALGYVFMTGIGEPKDLKKSCFYYKLVGNMTGAGGQVCRQLSTADLDNVDSAVRSWKPKEPKEYRHYGGVLGEEGTALSQSSLAPLNIPALLCGGTSHRCRVEATCDDLAAIRCPNSSSPYVIANKITKSAVSACSLESPNKCENFMPASWNCTLPKNMPPAILAEDAKPLNSEKCVQTNPTKVKMDPILQDVQSINLHVVLLSRAYDEVFTCHGREDECSDREIRKKWLKKAYREFPKSLRPDVLTDHFSTQIKEDLSSLFIDQCTVFKILNDVPVGHCIDVTSKTEEIFCAKKRLADYTSDPNALTFTVTVKIENDLDTQGRFNSELSRAARDAFEHRIFVLTWTPYRAGCTPEYMHNILASAVIPLNIGPDEVNRKITQFFAEASFATKQFLKTSRSTLFRCSKL